MTHENKMVLVVGATGMLGTEVVSQLRRDDCEVTEAIWPPLNDVKQQLCLDITDAEAVRHVFDWVRPGVVFNCSAFTDVDGAEEKENLATAVNARGVGHLAELCHERDILLVHVSTDYVFDGRGKHPYKPTDPTAPQGAYGRSKLAGEQAIRYYLGPSGAYAMVRTSWLFGPAGKNFIDTILRLAREKPSLKVVNDQVGCPTFAPDLARCLIDLAHKQVTGLYHFCNPPACTWYDFARRAVELAELDCHIDPCTTGEFPRPAPRPAYSVMDCTDTFDKLGWSARPWQEALAEYIRGLKQPVT